MRVAERTTPIAAAVAALTTLACCLPLSFLGVAGLAAIGSWAGPYRPWFLGLAVVLLVVGFVQIYRGRKQCKKRSSFSVALFWTSVVIVLLILFFPQVIASLLAG
jgi:mercuric ion transport protein